MEADEPAGMDAPLPLVQGLSRREFEVLRHIQMGLTNRQIADRLFVSCNTVNKHVHQVLTKLAVSNRVQAAVYRVEGEATRSERRARTSPG